MDINSIAPINGRILAEDGSIVNIVDLMGGAKPVSDAVFDIETFTPRSGMVIGEDGRLYSFAELLKNLTLASRPHLWPTDGSEVDLCDGTFGRRWKRWNGVGPTSAFFQLTSFHPSNIPASPPTIVDCGGQIWADFIPSTANSGFVFLGDSVNHKAEGGPWFDSGFEIDEGGQCLLRLQNMQPAKGMDVWVRYTK